MRILMVNTVAAGGAVAGYMEAQARQALDQGHQVMIARGRGPENPLQGVQNMLIGSRMAVLSHLAATRLADRHGLASRRATERFIREAEAWRPDEIQLHNIHGYYLHYPTLMEWLARYGRPVVWTLHDSWAFTGHCASWGSSTGECLKWQTGCRGKCPLAAAYPAAFRPRAEENFKKKIAAFTSVPQLRLVAVSRWLADRVGESALAALPCEAHHPEVDSVRFHQVDGIGRRRRVLAVASKWTEQKGFGFFKKLRAALPEDVEIRLIGRVPHRIDGVDTPGIITGDALVREYCEAQLVVSASYAETYGMVLREAIACGCRVAVRRAGGITEGLPLSAIVADTDEELLAAVCREFGL